MHAWKERGELSFMDDVEGHIHKMKIRKCGAFTSMTKGRTRLVLSPLEFQFSREI